MTIGIASQTSSACTYGSLNTTTTEQIFDATDQILIGKVVSIDGVSEFQERLEVRDGTVYAPLTLRVRFAALDIVKGTELDEISVYTHAQVPACGFPFTENGKYLVIAIFYRKESYRDRLGGHSGDSNEGKDDKVLWTDLCTNTRSIKELLETESYYELEEAEQLLSELSRLREKPTTSNSKKPESDEKPLGPAGNTDLRTQ